MSGSFVNEDLTQEEMEEAINTWIEIEDDEDIQNAEMEEEMKKLEQVSEEDEEDAEPEEEWTSKLLKAIFKLWSSMERALVWMKPISGS